MSLLYLAPFIAPDLHLSHTEVGLPVSALALAWAFSALAFAAISDRIGRRPVLVPAVFAFSVLSWLSGVVRSFGELFTVRILMGLAEGPTWSTMTATVEESSARSQDLLPMAAKGSQPWFSYLFLPRAWRQN